MTEEAQQFGRSARPKGETPVVRWCIGLVMSSVFSLSYFIAPFYMLTAILALIFHFPSIPMAWLFASPIIISAIFPPIASPWLLKMLSPMLDYFEYEQIHETSPVDTRKEILNGKNYLLVMQPHGSISFVSIASAIAATDAFRGTMPTAVADALLYTPILKHVLGIFGLVSASKQSVQKQLKKKGPEGCVVLYVGGMAELFLSCENEEKVYLKSRKGFVKLALQSGVDIVPVYLFGNTNVLSVLKTGVLAYLSRKLQVSLTYIWGRWLLPIPRDCKLLYVAGQPLGMPKLENPSNEEIDKWHSKYCHEVERLFEKYKEKVPEYKHKKLEIV
jgi:1-acyl-sn-glycerol-3-phosphate acyltransferase